MATQFDLSLITAPERTVYYTAPGIISGKKLLSYAWALAARLPDCPIINLHNDPLHFTIVFLSALLKGQYCLLCSDHTLPFLKALQTEYKAICTGTSLPEGLDEFSLPPLRELISDRTDNPVLSVTQKVACLFTSGSTGQPQMHKKHWGELVARSHTALQLLGPVGTTLLGTVPPYHMYGFETFILQSLHTPMITASGPCFFPADIEKLAANTPSPHILITSPVHLQSLTTARASLPGLIRIISAAAPLTEELAHEAEKLFHAPVMEIYGATEIGSIAIRRTISSAPWQLYKGITLTADLSDDGEESQLVNAPYATPYPLNDIIVIEGTGYFRLVRRKADILKIAGKRSSYEALNKILCEQPGVLDGCFAPLYTEQALKEGKNEPIHLQAFVVGRDIDLTALMQSLRYHIDQPFTPRRLVRLKSLPRNSVGKLTRQALDILVKNYAEKCAHPPFKISSDHPALPGHFPGDPIVPGILLLNKIFEQLSLKVQTIETVKFLSIVRPGELMQLFSSALGDERIQFSLHYMDSRKENTVILRGCAQGQT